MREILTGRFRDDLYHRLAVFPVRMPPLRERPEDVSHLADVLLIRIARDLGRPGLSLDEGARGAIVAADFPGNVRELRNALERAAILAESTRLSVEDIMRVLHGRGHQAPAPAVAEAPTMEEAEQAAIRRALAQSSGNRKKAAEHLGIGLRTLYEKLKKYGIR
jgi:two-component system response regulator FlrC